MQFVVYEEFFQAVQPVNQSGFKYGWFWLLVFGGYLPDKSY